ncbi:alpha/beta hydrolase [Methylophaga nitratireducenticrescens]|uniref:alpha/beta hydrolase n=1 Tax=Methylophaga nitratireducenticrescens TaxID=754476 RepID=UPI000CDCA3F6|nr:dienelactone hydrolase family protein [Methylophaga nitratireducenticrescens]AUZ85826.1 carboxylesterase [Methylophaga nitratireducenticrescens]
MAALLPHIEIETLANPNASVIWLHGLGADGHDFEPIVQQLSLPDDAAIRFIFPHAPSLAVTINGGMVMPAWYDILEMQIERKVDESQLRVSATAINDLITNEFSRGIVSERIIIAGFSQGGAVAFEVALSHPNRLAGLLALSTYFATKDSIKYHPANSDLPIAIHHGDQDSIVPIQLANNSSELLLSKAYNVELKQYPMEHSVCSQQIADIRQWLIKTLVL